MWPTRGNAHQPLLDVTWETRALLDNTRPHFWRPATRAASVKEVASMLGSPYLSPRKPIHKMAKAARWISWEKHGGESPMSSCQNCATAGSMAVEPCSRSCRIFHGNESLGQSRNRTNTPQIMRLNIPSLATQSQRALDEFLSKWFRFFALFQSTWRLPVVTRPHLQTSGRGSSNWGRLFHIPLLSLILHKQINTAHPVSDTRPPSSWCHRFDS